MGSFGLINRMRGVFARDVESWMSAHRESMAWYDDRDDFQGWVANLNAVYSFVTSHLDSWEKAVEDGTAEFETADEDYYLNLHRQWLAVARPAIEHLEELLKQAAVTGGDTLRRNVRSASEYLERAERIAARERSVGMRDVRLSGAEGAALNRIIAEANPGLMPANEG